MNAYPLPRATVRLSCLACIGFLTLVFLWPASPAFAGPNAGGTLVVHDTGLAYTDDLSSYPSTPPTCAGVDHEIDPGAPTVWKVYAAMDPNSSPRLKALAWGITLSPEVFVLNAGLPDPVHDFEITQNGWPNTSGAGIGQSFGVTQTAHVIECYWFGGYSESGHFATSLHPVQESIFVDDSYPPFEDPIAGFGSIGFGVAGFTPCPSTTMGACCFPDGHCELLLAWDCTQAGGAIFGEVCDPNPCPQPPPPGACCFADGACVLLQPEICLASGGQLYGETCDPNPCPQPPPVGACCLSWGACQILPEPECLITGGIFHGGSCSPNPCPQPAACCFADGACQMMLETACADAGGVFDGGYCWPNPCPQPPPEACCFSDGSCVAMYEAPCGAAGGTYHGGPCEPNPCPSSGGVNEDGVLVVHDTGLAYTSDSSSYPSDPPPSCDDVDGSAPPDLPTVWKVYAAFPPQNQPRLKALAFGEAFDPSLVTILAAGLPSELDFEIPQDGWPNTPGGGVGISFAVTQTDPIVEVYWFGGYGLQGGSWATAPHPVQSTVFVDDAIPPHETPIAALGSIGFGVAGETPCGFPTPSGACCFVDGSCTMTTGAECATTGGVFYDGPCDPNPCPQPPPTGACCFSSGACVVTTQSDCTSSGGAWYDGPCDPNPCPQPPPTGACCFSSGACVVTTESACTSSGGTWYGGPCNPNPCPQPPSGACCFGNGACAVMTASACAGAGGTYYGGSCDPNPCPQPPPPPGGGGDTIAEAVIIPALPFNDAGTTLGYVNDYDEVCPYTGSTSPDVVYAFTPTASLAFSIDLCASAYDTKVYVYVDSPSTLLACNDDAGCGYSGWQSKIDNLVVAGGHTYYIVIDGYGGSSGIYSLSIEAYSPCVVECPNGAQIEGEPPCADDYYDQYNGGCNTTGWTEVYGQGGGCADVCGRSCTYLYQGSSYRDTDWYAMYAQGGLVTATCEAEFPLQFILIYGPDCNNLQYDLQTAGPCTPTTLTHDFGAGAEFWLWVGPSTFSGVPESDYAFRVCGIVGGATPVYSVTWGAVKAWYRHTPDQREELPARAHVRSTRTTRPPSGAGAGTTRAPDRLGVKAPPKETP